MFMIHDQISSMSKCKQLVVAGQIEIIIEQL